MINIIYQNIIPNPDSMPAIFTAYYFPAVNNVNVLSQLRAAYISGQGLWLDFSGFEHEPFYDGSIDHSSCVAFSIAGENVLTAVAPGLSEIRLFLNGNEWKRIEPLSHYSGEDEQGWYRGVRFKLSDDTLKLTGLTVPLTPDNHPLTGFYTFQRDGNRPHFGSAEPVISASPFDRANLTPASFIVF